jgi:hypothetical protein
MDRVGWDAVATFTYPLLDTLLGLIGGRKPEVEDADVVVIVLSALDDLCLSLATECRLKCEVLVLADQSPGLVEQKPSGLPL